MPAALEQQAGSGYDPRHFARLFAVEDRHFWFRARNEVIAKLTRRLVANLPPGYRALEAGCGNGNTLRVLEQVCGHGRVCGMDLFAEGLTLARQRVGCPLVQGDLRTPPFRAGFDLVGLFDVLEHIPDDRQALRDIHALLKPGGALLLTVPAHMSLWSYADEKHHCRRYEFAELRDRLTEAGFVIEFQSWYMMALYPLMKAGRQAAARLRRGDSSVARAEELAEQELRIVPGLNGLLLGLLRLEQPLLARYRRLPLGASLLAVARRPESRP